MFEYARQHGGPKVAALAAIAILTVAPPASAAAVRPGSGASPIAAVTGRAADGADALLQAVRGGDLEAVRSALAAGADVELPDSADRRTPLMIAAGMGRADIVEALLQAGADVNRRDQAGRTALHLILADLEPKPEKKKRGGFGLGSLGNLGKSLGVDRVAGQADGLLRGALGSGVLSRGVGRSLLSSGDLSTLLSGGPGAIFQMADPRHWNAVVGAALLGDEKVALEGLTAGFDAANPDSWVRVLRPAAKGQPRLLRAMENVAEASDPATKQQWEGFLKAAGRGDANAVRQFLNDPRLAPLLGAAGDGIRTAADALPGRDGGVSVANFLLAGGANLGATDEQGRTPAGRARSAGLTEVADLLEKSAATLP